MLICYDGAYNISETRVSGEALGMVCFHVNIKVEGGVSQENPFGYVITKYCTGED